MLTDMLERQINAILHTIQYLLDDPEMTDKQRDLLHIIHRNGVAMKQLYEAWNGEPRTDGDGLDSVLVNDAAYLRHTLGNMLTPIRGYAQVLREGAAGILTPAHADCMLAVCTVADSIRSQLIEMKTAQEKSATYVA